jgi:hypothetical protein
MFKKFEDEKQTFVNVKDISYFSVVQDDEPTYDSLSNKEHFAFNIQMRGTSSYLTLYFPTLRERDAAIDELVEFMK